MSNIQPKIISQAKKEENMNYDDKKTHSKATQNWPRYQNQQTRTFGNGIIAVFDTYKKPSRDTKDRKNNTNQSSR